VPIPRRWYSGTAAIGPKTHTINIVSNR
jgi:hypothetical protein